MGHGRREHPSAPRRALHLSRAVRGRGSIHVSGPATNKQTPRGAIITLWNVRLTRRLRNVSKQWGSLTGAADLLPLS